MTKLFVLGNIGNDFNNFLAAVNDPESGVKYLASEKRLEINDGYAHVAISPTWGIGPNDLLLAQIYANTRAYYAKQAQPRLFMLWGNKGSVQEYLAIELNNHFVKECITSNAADASDSKKMGFAEHLVELLFLGAAYGLKLTFEDDNKIAFILSALKLDAKFIKGLVTLMLKASKTEAEIVEQTKRLGQFRWALEKYIGQDEKAISIRLRTAIWNLFKGVWVEGVGLEQGALDMKGNYDNLLLLYLKWTLGDEAFEYRRSQLESKLNRKPNDKEVMDEIILDAIDVKDGAYRQIIEKSIAALCLDQTLFLHAGMDNLSLVVGGIDYSGKSIYEWIDALNFKFKRDLKLTYSGDLRTVELLARDRHGSTAVQFDPANVHPAVIAFLQKNKIKHVVTGYEENPGTVLGSQFVQAGITFACLDFCRSDNSKEPMCYAQIDGEEMVIRANLHMPVTNSVQRSVPMPMTICDIAEPVVFGEKNDLGFAAGTYLLAATKSRNLIFTLIGERRRSTAVVPADVMVVAEGAIDRETLKLAKF